MTQPTDPPVTSDAAGRGGSRTPRESGWRQWLPVAGATLAAFALGLGISSPLANRADSGGGRAGAATEAGYSWLRSGRYQFDASGLTNDPSELPVYLVRAGELDQERVDESAAALGIADQLTETEFGWELPISDEPSAPTLMVSRDQLASFYFYDPSLSPGNECYDVEIVSGRAPGEDEAAASGDDEAAAEASEDDEAAAEARQKQIDDCLRQAQAEAPSGEEAAQRLTEVITALGLDSAQYQISGENQQEVYQDGATAEAKRVLDGVPADVGFHLTLTGRGMLALDGSLGVIETAGPYPIVGEQTAFERLSDPRFGTQGYSGGGVMPLAESAAAARPDEAGALALAEDEATGGPQVAAVPQTAPAPGGGAGARVAAPQSPEPAQPGDDGAAGRSTDSSAGSDADSSPQSKQAAAPGSAPQSAAEIPEAGVHPQVSWPVEQVHIESAEIFYALHANSDEDYLLVPTYRFTDSSGEQWEMIAVADESLDFSAAQG